MNIKDNPSKNAIQVPTSKRDKVPRKSSIQVDGTGRRLDNASDLGDFKTEANTSLEVRMSALQKEVLACLRTVLRCRIESWDAARAAEILLDDEINCERDEISSLLATLDNPEEVEGLSDTSVFAAFGIATEKPIPSSNTKAV